LELRAVALDRLSEADPEIVAFSLVLLGAVGRPEDLPVVDSTAAHPSELVRKAARACRFQLERAARERRELPDSR
jgi:hypothetical protein